MRKKKYNVLFSIKSQNYSIILMNIKFHQYIIKKKMVKE